MIQYLQEINEILSKMTDVFKEQEDRITELEKQIELLQEEVKKKNQRSIIYTWPVCPSQRYPRYDKITCDTREVENEKGTTITRTTL